MAHVGNAKWWAVQSVTRSGGGKGIRMGDTTLVGNLKWWAA
jgi:hypothetical protein